VLVALIRISTVPSAGAFGSRVNVPWICSNVP
jgi:hypothetical protein